MLNKLFQFYKDNLTFYSNVVKKNSKWKNSLVFALIGTSTCMFFAFIWLISQNKLEPLYLVIPLLVLAGTSILGRYINSATIRKYYPEYLINREGFNDLYESNLKSYLDNMNLTDSQLDILQDLVSDKIKRIQQTYLGFGIIFAIVFSPIWNKIVDLFQMKDIVYLLVLSSVAVLLLWRIRVGMNESPKSLKWLKINDLIKEYRINKK